MKRSAGIAFLAFMAIATYGQERLPSDYFVKTSSATSASSGKVKSASDNEADSASVKIRNFVADNFKYRSMCDWDESMRFMVIPEKYDLVVNIFRDAKTKHEVSNIKMRHKILRYKGYVNDERTNRLQLNFLCEDDGQTYFFEVNNSDFDDYCFSRAGVPTLAYLNDVDLARSLLQGVELTCIGLNYRQDVDLETDNWQPVEVAIGTKAIVTAVGVGTRDCPVKLVLRDELGREFYQNVALSSTNIGIHTDDFSSDSDLHLFYDSFEVPDDELILSPNWRQYAESLIHTTRVVNMVAEDNVHKLNIDVCTGFFIDNMEEAGEPYVLLTLKDQFTARPFYVKTIFDTDKLTAENRDDYFGAMFNWGSGKKIETTSGMRALIRQGHVSVDMNLGELKAAAGLPAVVNKQDDGTEEWIYNRSEGQKLHVFVSPGGRVLKYNVVKPPKPSFYMKSKK